MKSTVFTQPDKANAMSKIRQNNNITPINTAQMSAVKGGQTDIFEEVIIMRSPKS